MLNYSFSTVLMTVLTSNLLIAIIALCFQSKERFQTIGYKLLAIFLLFTLVRFAFPFEISFAKTVNLPKALSVPVLVIRHVFFTVGRINFSIWFLFECVWVGGIAVMLAKFLYEEFVYRDYVKRYGLDVTSHEPYSLQLSKVCDSHKNQFKIVLVPGIDTPCQYGLVRPLILLPAGMELTENDIYYTLCHEIFHYRHHDNLIKLGVKLLSILYWWNPLCKQLKNQTDLIIEMRNDDKLIKNDADTRRAYLSTLMHIAHMAREAVYTAPKPSYLTVRMTTGDIEDLETRTHMMYGKKKSSKILLAGILSIVTTLYICSFCFTFEAWYVPFTDDLEEAEVYPEQEMYAVQMEDGFYDIYWSGELIDHTISLDLYPNVSIIN